MIAQIKIYLRRLVRRYLRQMPSSMTLKRVGESYVYYNSEHLIYIRDYYLYCVDLICAELKKRDVGFNLIIGDYEVKFDTNKKTKRVDVQFEHTLVRPGGRDTKGAIQGKVTGIDGAAYLVRIANFDHYRSMDGVIEYSMPNMENIRRCGGYDRYLDKCFYVSPLLYSNMDFLGLKRSRGVITTFNNENEPRRKSFLEKVSSAGISISNEKNRFDRYSIGSLYRDSRILVNIRQTPHHHTFEELRVLPALLCGCLVISEDVPLRETIPYKDFVIWADMDSIVDVIREVQSNYQFYFDRIFSHKFFESMERLELENKRVIGNLVDYINIR